MNNREKTATTLVHSVNAHTRIRLDEMDKPGTYIISFWNTPQIHTVAVSYDGGSYTTYNFNGHKNDLPSNYASRYICGYYLG